MSKNEKVCLVTGANSGIGRETTLGLARLGGTIVMLARNLERGEVAKDYVIRESGNSDIDLMICDLSVRNEIERFSSEFTQNYPRLDVLVNNAGAVFSRRQLTQDGFENTLAVNYLAPFLLTNRLLPLLRKSAPSRVVNLTSGLHSRGRIDLDDLQSEKHYKSMDVYQNSKLMVLLFTYKLARELEGTGVTVNAVSPGFVATNLGRNSGSRMSKVMFGMMRPFQLSPTEGARTSIYVASSPEIEDMTGKHFAKSQQKESAAISHDKALQDALWKKTRETLNL